MTNLLAGMEGFWLYEFEKVRMHYAITPNGQMWFTRPGKTTWALSTLPEKQMAHRMRLGRAKKVSDLPLGWSSSDFPPHEFTLPLTPVPAHVEELPAAITMSSEPLADDELSQQSVPGGFAKQITETVATRGSAYGSPAENHQTTADMFSTWLSRRLRTSVKLTAEDVIAFNVIQKISRAAFCSKDDTWLDVAGYAENVAMIRPDQRNHVVESKHLSNKGATYNIQKGDVVKLKNPAKGFEYDMTVCRIDECSREVDLQYFDSAMNLRNARYPLIGLEFVRR